MCLSSVFFFFSTSLVLANPTSPPKSCLVFLQGNPEHQAQLKRFDASPLFGGQSVQTFDAGGAVLGGTALALQFIHPATSLAKPILDQIVGHSVEGLEVSAAVTGSVARYALFGNANDLDIEGMLVAQAKSGSTQDLYNPKSRLIQRIARYLKAHVEKVLQENPEIRFIELKAGEYVDVDTSERKGIKWWLEDLRRGYKIVHEAQGNRRVTLAQALAEPARIKIDWAVPAVIDPINRHDYTETTVMYQLGLRVGNNQARLRYSEQQDENEALPIRATSVTLSAEDLKAALEVSSAERSTSLENVHQSLQKTMLKYIGVDRLKITRRVFALLQFWESVDDFHTLTGQDIKRDELLRQFHEILTHPPLVILSRIRARAEIRMIALEHGVQLPEGPAGDEAWLNQVRLNFGLSSTTLEELVEDVKKRIEKNIVEYFQTYPHVARYIDFVLARSTYVAHQPLSKEPVFLVLKPSREFVSKLNRKITVWRKKYPALEFPDAEDAHMTVHFTGKLTDTAMDTLMYDAKGKIQNYHLEGGGLFIMGRRSQVIAAKFSSTTLLSQNARVLRAKAGAVGAVPEKTFLSFTPHISIAQIRSGFSAESRKQAKAFLTESLGTLESVDLVGFEIWGRNPQRTDSNASTESEYVRVR